MHSARLRDTAAFRGRLFEVGLGRPSITLGYSTAHHPALELYTLPWNCKPCPGAVCLAYPLSSKKLWIGLKRVDANVRATALD